MSQSKSEKKETDKIEVLPEHDTTDNFMDEPTVEETSKNLIAVNLAYIAQRKEEAKRMRYARHEQCADMLRKDAGNVGLIKQAEVYERKAQAALKRKNAMDFNYYARAYEETMQRIDERRVNIEKACEERQKMYDMLYTMLVKFYDLCADLITAIDNVPGLDDATKYNIMKEFGVLDLESVFLSFTDALATGNADAMQKLINGVKAARNSIVDEVYETDEELPEEDDDIQQDEEIDQSLIGMFDNKEKKDYYGDQTDTETKEEEEVDPSTHSVNTNDDDFTFDIEEEIKKIKA